MTIPDALSQRANHMEGEEEIREQVMLPEEIFICSMEFKEEWVTVLPQEVFLGGLTYETVELHKPDENLQQRFIDATNEDVVKEAIEAIKTGRIPSMKTALTDWQMEDGLVFFKGRCYVPDNTDLQRDIVKFYHNNRTAGHPGFNKTLDLV